MASKKMLESFNKKVIVAITKLGATESMPKYSFQHRYDIQTPAGLLEITLPIPDEKSVLYSIFTIFENPRLANEVLTNFNKENLNSFSGKWNYHYLKADDCFNIFINSLTELLNQKHGELSGLYDLRVNFGTGLGWNEACSRVIRDCFIRHQGELDKGLMDKTIAAVGTHNPEYVKAWKKFKKEFEIKEEKGKYINSFLS